MRHGEICSDSDIILMGRFLTNPMDGIYTIIDWCSKCGQIRKQIGRTELKGSLELGMPTMLANYPHKDCF